MLLSRSIPMAMALVTTRMTTTMVTVWLDSSDAFPLDATESVDTDGDGVGNNADTDDDGDGVADSSDAFPLDATDGRYGWRWCW